MEGGERVECARRHARRRWRLRRVRGRLHSTLGERGRRQVLDVDDLDLRAAARGRRVSPRLSAERAQRVGRNARAWQRAADGLTSSGPELLRTESAIATDKRLTRRVTGMIQAENVNIVHLAIGSAR